MAAPKVSKLCQECQHGDLEAHAKDANNFAFEEVHDGAEWDAQMKAFVEGVPAPTKKKKSGHRQGDAPTTSTSTTSPQT